MSVLCLFMSLEYLKFLSNHSSSGICYVYEKMRQFEETAVVIWKSDTAKNCSSAYKGISNDTT